MNWRALPVTGLMVSACSSYALDTGLPYHQPDVDARVTVEVMYDRLERDIEQDIAFEPDRFKGVQTEDRVLSRLYFFVNERLTIHALFGSTYGQNATDASPVYGGGATVRLVERGPWSLHAFAAGYYVDEIEYRVPGFVTPVAELAAVRRVEDYVDYGGGFTVAFDLARGPVYRVTPYAGATLTAMDADGDEHFTFTSIDRDRRDDDVGFDEDGVFGLTAGLAIQVRRNFGARLEGRFVNQASYTAGMFFSF